MQHAMQAQQAYEAASRFRSQREQEADIFRRATAVLKAAREANKLERVRALADNRLLWGTVGDLVCDPENPLPVETRAGLISVTKSVQREMDQEAPDFDFLIAINESVSAGLSAKP